MADLRPGSNRSPSKLSAFPEPSTPMHRLVGLETEYGCLSSDPSGPGPAVARLRDWIFGGNRLGLLDRHQRDWDEPAGNGGFLFNGGRAYVDMGHLEICTPECLGIADLVRFDRAGDRMLSEGVAETGLGDVAGFLRNNVDHFTGATFGCHENYLVRRTAPLHERNVISLLAFLALRTLYTGAGKVGGVPGVELGGGGESPPVPIRFQISQRADYIQNELFEWVQFNRSLINTRDEPLADSRRFRRLHLLHGDTSVLPWTLAMKVGTTALVLDLLEIDHLPSVSLQDSVAVLRRLSRQPDGPWRVPIEGSSEAEAVEVLARYQRLAESEFRGRDAETDLVLSEWRLALEALENGPETLVGRVDWITKRWLLRQFVESEGLDWSDDWLKSLDLEFHHVDPERNLAWPTVAEGTPWTPSPEAVAAAMDQPPADTRAAVRGRAVRELAGRKVAAFLDWEVVDAEGVNPLMLPNPFDPDPAPLAEWLQGLDQARPAASPAENVPPVDPD
jgi:proteasome accessory factor A